MKVYIKAVSIEDLRKQYKDIPERTFSELIDLDPTADFATNRRGKYGPWILKQYKLGNLTPDTYNTVTDALSELADPVRRRRYELKDLNQYKTVQDLIDAHIAAQNVELELSQRQQSRQAHKQAKEMKRKRLAGEDTGDITELVSEGDWTVYTPNTWAGAIALAMEGVDTSRPYTGYGAPDDNRKAEWCTAGEKDSHWYNHYTSRGPLYVFINSKDPINKFQSCPASGSWWFDKYDHEHGKRAFLDFCSEHPVIGDFFEVKTVGGVQVMGTTIQGYDPNATEISIPDGVSTFPSFQFPNSCIKVTLPDTITTITSGVFSKTNVETVVAHNIEKIERRAFADSKIRDIDLSTVTFIGAGAFRNCPNLTAVSIRSDATIQSFAFAECNLTGSVTQYPETTITIGTYDNNPNLTVVWKDADVKYAFHNIKELVLDSKDYPKLIGENRAAGVPIRFE